MCGNSKSDFEFPHIADVKQKFSVLNNAIKVLPVPRFIANAVPDFTMNAGIEKEVSQHDYLPPTPKSADLFD